MQEKINSAPDATADVEHNKTENFVAVATTPTITLPRSARLPINRCNLPADILGGLTFQRYPVPLELDGVAEFHRGLFALLDRIADAEERAEAFMLHMNAAFYLDDPEQAGYTAQATHKRQKADYLRMVRGWSFDADGREGAALKGWVESRFGLLPRHHGGPIRDFSGEAYRRYLEMRATALYGTNALEAQFDLLYAYCQYELARAHPSQTHLTLYRGVNRVDDHETLAQQDDKRRVVLLNSLSSFTANRERADEFGDYLLTAEVPLAKIAYYTKLLPGMLKGEEEYAVIGGMYEITITPY
ncbi:MAG TPA: NAD(+)--dinitrogen-reductase ADP-D-ribosyltransferase [Gallionella sp.]|nr:NAD(+)--dinitrogen-reductase ADP-D-ribosyltransferase [Gallionella sp.]